MTSKIKNIAIFVGIGLVVVLVYSLFIKKPAVPASLVSAPGATATSDTGVADQNSLVAQNFLSLLLNVKGISLDVDILSDPAFDSLQDSSIVLVPDGTEGRPNPFAPIGSDIVVTPPTPAPTTDSTSPTSNPSTNPSTAPTSPTSAYAPDSAPNTDTDTPFAPPMPTQN